MDIYIFGLGAIGSNLLVQLARVYPETTFHGIDFDKVEERNLRTQAYFLEHLNQPKALAMQAVLHRIHRKPKYRPLNQKITGPVPIEKNSLVLDCFDNVESRAIVRKLQCEHILHAGFSPEFTADIGWESKKYVLGGPVKEGVDICTLNAAGPFIMHITSFVSMKIVDFIENGTKKDYLYSAGTWKKV